jgi:hypothetical protein
MSAEWRGECRVSSVEWAEKKNSPLFLKKRAKQKQKKDNRSKVSSGLFQQ